jgi:hypothetical protein
MTTAKRTFHWRAFVSFYILLSALVVAISGSVLYIAPPGRIANWSYWALGSLDKASWQAVHTIFAFLFVVGAAFHLYFNWGVILSYLKNRLGEGMRRKWELASSGGMVVSILAVTLAGVPPFGTIMTVGEQLKNSWATSATEPPVPHAETWNIVKFSDTMKVPVEKAMSNLQAAGIQVSSTEVTLLELARQHRLTPQQVFTAAMGGASKPRMPAAEGGGWGTKTVQQVCEQLEVPLESGLERLRAGGIEPSAASNIRELALKNGKSPIELVKLVEGPTER